MVGSASVDIIDEHEHAYVYYNGRIKDIGGLHGATDSFGFGINNLNQVVGESYTAPKPIKDSTGKVIGETPSITVGFVDLDGTLRDVNKLLNQSGKGWVVSDCRGINDFGKVLADASFNGGRTHAVELTPNAVLPNLVP